MSILSNIAKGLKLFFSSPAVKAVETVAVPLVETFFPAITPLISGIMTEVGKVEALAASAGMQTGTGSKKLALVLQTAESIFNAYEKAQGVTISQTGKEAIVNGVVAILNALPSA
jgi:hypothetical protein